MELNAEQIKNAVACRTGNIIGCMNDECAYFHKGCDRPLFEDVLLLIEFYEDKIFELEQRPPKLIITKLRKKENENV